MEITKHDLCCSAHVFLVLQQKLLDAVLGTRILNFTILALIISRITYGSKASANSNFQMVWYYDVVE